MGIIARYNRRQDRDRIRLKQLPYHVKHRLATTTTTMTRTRNVTMSPLSKNYSALLTPTNLPTTTLAISSLQSKHNTPNNRVDAKIQVDINISTASTIQREVTDLLHSSSDQKCTVLEMANALGQSQACLESHSKVNNDEYNGLLSQIRKNLGKIGQRKTSRGIFSFKFPGRAKKNEKESMSLRYEWIGALNRLEKRPPSRDKVVSSWEEAKKCLEDVLCFADPIFPATQEIKNNSHADDSSSIAKKHANNLEAEIDDVQENINALSVNNNNVKWKQIASYPDEQRRSVDKTKKTGDEPEEEEDLDTLIRRESIDKVDMQFNARIRTAEQMETAWRKNDSFKKLEERMKTDEAKKRAASLMRPFNQEEQRSIQNAIYGYGHDEDIISQDGTDSVQRQSMQTLKPGMWLNDEIIHYFYLMLSKRDEELCKKDPTRQRSHFFKSFFITKILNEGSATCDGKYEYRNVKRWSKKVPGKDIFKLDKILFPINMGNMHWIAAAIFMKQKRIEIFDSLGSDGSRYLNALFSYIQDEHMDKKKTPLPDIHKWESVPTQEATPRQRNGTCCMINISAISSYCNFVPHLLSYIILTISIS